MAAIKLKRGFKAEAERISTKLREEVGVHPCANSENPFSGATTIVKGTQLNKNSRYNDIMIFKK